MIVNLKKIYEMKKILMIVLLFCLSHYCFAQQQTIQQAWVVSEMQSNFWFLISIAELNYIKTNETNNFEAKVKHMHLMVEAYNDAKEIYEQLEDKWTPVQENKKQVCKGILKDVESLILKTEIKY